MIWAIVDEDGQVLTDTFADHPNKAWHRFIQNEGARDKEDAVTKVLEAQTRGWTCERLLVEDAHKRLTMVSSRV
jgi:hypothetical protein